MQVNAKFVAMQSFRKSYQHVFLGGEKMRKRKLKCLLTLEIWVIFGWKKKKKPLWNVFTSFPLSFIMRTNKSFLDTSKRENMCRHKCMPPTSAPNANGLSPITFHFAPNSCSNRFKKLSIYSKQHSGPKEKVVEIYASHWVTLQYICITLSHIQHNQKKNFVLKRKKRKTNSSFLSYQCPTESIWSCDCNCFWIELGEKGKENAWSVATNEGWDMRFVEVYTLL